MPSDRRASDGGDTEFGHAGRDRGAGDCGGTVAVPVGFHHGHHLGRTGVGEKHRYVVRDGIKVDDGPAVDRRALRGARRGRSCGLHAHVTVGHSPTRPVPCAPSHALAH